MKGTDKDGVVGGEGKMTHSDSKWGEWGEETQEHLDGRITARK